MFVSVLQPNTMLYLSEQNRTEQNIYLFTHSAYIAHSLNTNTAWKRKMKNEKCNEEKQHHKVNN